MGAHAIPPEAIPIMEANERLLLENAALLARVQDLEADVEAWKKENGRIALLYAGLQHQNRELEREVAELKKADAKIATREDVKNVYAEGIEAGKVLGAALAGRADDADGRVARNGSADPVVNAECPHCHGTNTHKIHRPEVYEFGNLCRDCDRGF